MRFSTVLLLTASLGVGAVACATTGAERTTTGGNLLEAAEIAEGGPQIRTALDAVEHLRPQFLRTRANPTIGGRPTDPVQVYVNGTLWGGPEALSRLRAEEIVRIRYIRPTDAQTRFGLDHGSGAMEVTTTGR